MAAEVALNPFLIFIVIMGILAAVILLAGVKVVPQGSMWTVERFGRYTRTLRPGLEIIVPFVDRIGHKMSVKETVLDIPAQDVITLDNATVTADGILFFQVVEPAKAAYEVNDLVRALSNLAMTNIRSVIGGMNLDDVLSKRDDINDRLLRVIDAASNPWGVKVARIEIKDLSPPRDLVDAMAQQMKAEREKRAEILAAEGAKQSAILRAEGEKQAVVLEAEGRKEAAYRDAEAREREAEAEAKATAMVSTAISEGDVQAVNYFVAQRYVDAFQTLANSRSDKLVLMPMEASGVLGSLGGLGELAKAAFGDDAKGGKNAPGDGPWKG